MESSSCMLPILVLVVLSFHFGVAHSSSFLQQPSCHDEESSALLQFKQSLVVVGNDSKLLSWKPPVPGENKTCCSWDGVECDEKTGHVIGLDLMSSGLYGSINSNSTLFHLVHLESLDLSSNDFNSSQIPPTIRNLSKLRYLDLSNSGFSGQIPSEISQLSKLISLILEDCDQMLSNERFLRSLAQNLTSLEVLSLENINISSTVPDTLANLSHLKILFLKNCSMFGKLPISLGKLKNLFMLELSSNEFTGQIPASFGNLTQLNYLWLKNNQFSGTLPATLGRLARLGVLAVPSNQLSGTIPAFLGNMTSLGELWISKNNFYGSIPESLFNLMNLESLSLDYNNLSGTVEFHKFLRLQKLTILDLSKNKLEVLTESGSLNSATTIVPKFQTLRLSWCNIREFPTFLRSLETLFELDLSGNKLQGQVPKWMWNTSTQTLDILNISHNSLSGFAQSPTILPWVNLNILDLSFNMFSDLVLLPSTTLGYYNIANNRVTGQISPIICDMTSLFALDLSNNKLIGDLPKCWGNFVVNLEILNIRNNSFHGIFPQSPNTNGSRLKMLDISYNNFHGQLPRSLANCASLESLVISHNKFNDAFPIWLGILPELRILTMDHNVFSGVIVEPDNDLYFPMMRILDLSYNNFSGEFPFEYIFSGNGTTGVTKYLDYYFQGYSGHDGTLNGVYYTITITSKGVEIYYPKVQKDLILIDISSNNFEGEIPEFIGNLKGIWSLNFSNNILTGSIPSSLSNLSNLESLDLSHNKLSGEIPQQLAQLDFLTKFNVSYNNLTGPVPRGIHFTTFDITSYQGNQGLCGDLLPNKCGTFEGTQLPPSTYEDNDSESGIELDWKFVVAGFGSGLLVGVVLADVVITKWSVRFIEIVAVLIRLSKRMRRPRTLIH